MLKQTSDTNLSLVGASASVKMEEAVAVSAEVAAYVTQDNSCCLAVIVIVTHGLWVGREGNKLLPFYLASYALRFMPIYKSNHLLLLSVFSHPATRREAVYVILVKNAQ